MPPLMSDPSLSDEDRILDCEYLDKISFTVYFEKTL